MPVIYVDVLLLLNVWVDFLLLSATARLRRIPVRRLRLLAGAVVGAVLACVLFLPPLPVWAALLIRVGGTVSLTRITFPFVGWRRFGGDLLTFAVLCAVFAGLADMLWYLLTPDGLWVVNGVVYYDAPASLLIVFTAISYGAVCLFDLLTRRKAPRNRRLTLRISHGGKTLVCDCLYDSGCTLKEPFSGKPAAVIDATAAAGILPHDWQTERDAATAAVTRWIPYRALGGEGLLPAFRPQRMELVNGAQRRDVSGCFLAVAPQLGDGEYVALVGTDLGDLTEGGRQ